MIKVTPLGVLAKYESFSVEVSTYRQLLAAMRGRYGESFFQEAKDILAKHLFKLKDFDEFLALDESLVDMELEAFSEYFIIPEFEGEISAAIISALISTSASAAGAGAVGASISAGVGAALAIAVNIGISLAIGAIVQALTPTPEFKTDPANAQLKRSSLFNGAYNVYNQGGSVPLCFGNPFCGGVVVSSGLYSEET